MAGTGSSSNATVPSTDGLPDLTSFSLYLSLSDLVELVLGFVHTHMKRSNPTDLLQDDPMELTMVSKRLLSK
jgi:hypothetical protein